MVICTRTDRLQWEAVCLLGVAGREIVVQFAASDRNCSLRSQRDEAQYTIDETGLMEK